MSHSDFPAPVRLAIPSWLGIVFTALIVAGTAGFLSGILGPHPLRAWQAYLVNFLFWTGLSLGAVLVVAVLNLTGAKWGRPLKRLAEAFGAFLPASFLFFWVLYFGRMELFPWIHHPVPARQVWLNVPFLFARNGAGLFCLTLVSLAMIYYSLKADRQWRADIPGGVEKNPSLKPWNTSWSRQQALSPVFAIAYSFILSLMAFDLVMSLDARWYSTLLAGYFFVGCFYTGVVALSLLSLFTAGAEGFQGHVIPRHFHDLGKLILAFCLFTGYLFYAQFLTIWYGNLPEETRYVILRVKTTPWEPLAWVTLFMIFLIPFFVLLSKRIKTKRLPMILLSLMIMAGMWLEKFILVAPSLWKQGTVPLGATEAFITAGYLGVVGLCLTMFLKRVPLLPVSDPLFRLGESEKEERLNP